MEKPEYKWLFENEDTNFYTVSVHNLIFSLIIRYLVKKQNLKILEAGCGTGLLAKKISRFGKVIGVDISNLAINYSKKRGVNAVKASVTKLPFKDNNFDLITSVDVISSKEADDQKALVEFIRVLKKGGIIILRVSANKWLRRKSDNWVHCSKRYNIYDLKTKLLKAGFKIEIISYIQMLLLPASALVFIFEMFGLRPEPRSPMIRLPKMINKLLIFLISYEEKLLRFAALPFGLGIIAVARKT